MEIKKGRKYVKGVIFSLMCSIVLQSGTMITYAEEENGTADLEMKEAQEELEDELPILPREEIEVPSVKSNARLRRSVGFPSYYNVSEEGYVTSVKSQGSYGTCWAFGAISTLESSLLRDGYGTNDLSEWHLAYYTYHSVIDPLGLTEGDSVTTIGNYATNYLNSGGDERNAAIAMFNWLGAVDESDARYSSIGSASTRLPDTVESAYEKDDFHVQNIYVSPSSYSDRDTIKRMICDYGGVGATYYSTSSNSAYVYDENGKATSANIFNSVSRGINHCVEIIGWDDDYAASNFKSTPPGDGAWIAKNSWGTSGAYTVNGYFYISFYDVSMNNPYNTVMALEAEAASNYENNYHYDGTSRYSPYETMSDNGSIASVFEAQGNESLEAVSAGFYSSNVEYSVQIYKNPEEVNGVVVDPTSGVAALKQPIEGSTTYSGFYTIPLDEPIFLQKGEKYAVVITMSGDSNMRFFVSVTSSSPSFSYVEKTNPGETFKKNASSSSWTDLNSLNKTARIHAYTNSVKLEEYTVTYQWNTLQQLDAEEYIVQQAVVGSLLTEPVAPITEGYLFTGWYKDAECTQLWDFAVDIVTADTVIYAGWEVDPTAQFTVTFDSRWSIGAPEEQMIQAGGLVTEPELGKSVIFEFQGWYTDTTFTTQWDFANDVVTGDMTLYLKWVLIPYTVTFDANGHGVAPDPITNIRYGRTISKPSNPVCEGYEFKGWYQDSSCKNGWDFARNTVTKNITLYAKWEATSTYQVNYYLNDSIITSETVTIGNILTEPEVELEDGNVITGWYTDATYTTLWDFSTDVVTGNLTLYALVINNSSIDTLQEYTVTFDSRWSVAAPASQIIQSGGIVIEPELGTSVIFQFEGWYKDTGFTQQWNFATDVVTADMTLYLKWQLIPYTVTFDVNGHGVAPDPITNIRYGRTINKPTNPICAGYEFDGWYFESSCKNKWDFGRNTVTKDITLYAKWTENTVEEDIIEYTVTFDSKGSIGAVDSQIVEAGGKITDPTTGDSVIFYFEGWYTESSFQNQWDFANDTVTSDMTLYLKWTLIPYTVTFDVNGHGSAVEPITNIRYGRTINKPTNPECEGYEFAGWYFESSCKNKWDFGRNTVTKDITLYAKWVAVATSQEDEIVTFSEEESIVKEESYTEEQEEADNTEETETEELEEDVEEESSMEEASSEEDEILEE